MSKLTDLPIDLINEIIFICDYKSILYLNCTCKLINNIDLENVLINKSKRIQNVMGNTDHLIPRSIVYNKENSLTSGHMIIAYLKHLFDNNINLAYDDKISPDNRPDSNGNIGCFGHIGFTGCKGITTTKYGDIVNPTYKIFEKFLKIHFY